MPANVTVDLFVSLDGFAGSDGLPGYFGYAGPELEQWIDAESSAPQTQVMGRRTHELLASLPDEARDEFSQRMVETPTVVFSRTLERAEWPRARVHRDDPVEELQRMKAAADALPMRTVGSLSIARQLLEAGVVDRLRLVTFPLLAGPAGREPAFAGVASADLELVGTRVLDGRLLLSEYRPTHQDVPRGTEQRERRSQERR